MDTLLNPDAVIGNNNPPDPLIAEAEERITTANRWLTERKEITDAAMADKLAFYISQVSGTFDALDEQRLQEGRDFKIKQDKKYSSPLDLLTRAKTALVALRTAWLKKEDARLLAEKAALEAEAKRKADAAAEAVRLAEEEAQKKGGDPLRAAAAADALKKEAEVATERAQAEPAKAVIKGTYTTRAVGLREVWDAQITDAAAAFKTYKKRPEVVTAIRDAMQKVAKADAQKLKDVTAAPAGVRFFSEKK